MRLAVICLGYLQSPAGIEMLARYFACLSADLYIHIDAKVSDAEYRAVPSRYPHAHLLAERLPIWWGGFNWVRATISAIRSARAAKTYDRYLLLSEDTVPLLAPTALAAHLEQDVEFLHSYPVPADRHDLKRRRYEGWYYFDCGTTCPRTFVPEDRTVDEGLPLAMQRLSLIRERGKYPVAELRCGSGWWALTDEAVARVLEVLDTCPWLHQSLEFSACPDEQYVQTILGLSNWPRKCRPFIHTDFSRDVKPYVYGTQAELAALQGGPCCMVRKVDIASPEIAAYMHGLASS